MPNVAVFIILALVIFVLVIISMSVKVVKQSTAYVIERFGAYDRTMGVGIHFIIPFFERIASKVTLKETVEDFPPQPVITKDNVTMQIDTVVYFQITDPKLFTYGVHNPINALGNLTATTLRNIIGDLELDETLTSRDTINGKMRIILDEATDPWGIKVNRVEVKNIIPPRDIQDAMEKQMRAERERREAILKAEGEKKAAILTAEGEKEALILRAEAKKQAEIAEAEGKATAQKLLADAQAYSIQVINNANPNKAYVTLKGYESLEKVANGQSTKLIIPSNLQESASFVTALSELVNTKKEDSSKTEKSKK